MKQAPATAFTTGAIEYPARAMITDQRVLVAILLLAGALRLIALPGAGFAHQDELFQYLEQAHRLAFGNGIVPWEYRYGIRGWLFPLLLSGPMKAGDLIAPGTMFYLVLPRLAMVAASLGIVAGAWGVGRRLSPLHGTLAAFVAAIWPELIHFAPHVLTEPLAVALIVPGTALLASPDPRRLVTAGVLLGVAGLLRFQYLPAIAALLLVAAGRRRAAWPALLAGGLIAAWIGAYVDLGTGQTPFAWAAANVRQNLLLHRAERYGVAGPLAYLDVMATLWGGWLLPILALAAIGARRQPALAAAALVNLAVHMAVGHKEYRFILLTTTLTVLLAALGTAEAVAWARARRNAAPLPVCPERSRGTAAPSVVEARLQDPRISASLDAPHPSTSLGMDGLGVMILWATAAMTLAASGRAATFDIPAAPARTLFARLAHGPALCGVAIVATSFADTGGYTLLHRPVPLFTYAADEALQDEARGFNRVIAPANHPITLPGFTRTGCAAGGSGYAPSCLYVRPGGCAPRASNHAIDRALIRRDE